MREEVLASYEVQMKEEAGDLSDVHIQDGHLTRYLHIDAAYTLYIQTHIYIPTYVPMKIGG